MDGEKEETLSILQDGKGKEQVEIFPEFYQLLSSIDQRLQHLEDQYTVIVNLLKSKLDLDKQEAELMSLIKSKVEQST